MGNSAAIRIPAPVLEASRLHLDDTVELGRKAKNLHEPVDFGLPEGRENW
jgi:antitoxin component of MazEF toxin-antitoxin module